MQRPRNRQGRSVRPNDGGQTQSSRGRGDRGYGQTAVPNSQQVIPNASVSIVLKIDQGTGRQVQGTVADVLTSGNHPRGIKVRLVDGRVGRVQRMVSGEEARVGSEGLVGLGRNGDGFDENGLRGGGGFGGGRGGQFWGGRGRGEGGFGGGRGGERGGAGTRMRGRYTDVREDEHFEEAPRAAGYNLGDFLPPDHPLMAQGAEQEIPNSAAGDDGGHLIDFQGAAHTCPVCGEFEGDEIAVSRHVGEHFD